MILQNKLEIEYPEKWVSDNIHIIVSLKSIFEVIIKPDAGLMPKFPWTEYGNIFAKNIEEESMCFHLFQR